MEKETIENKENDLIKSKLVISEKGNILIDYKIPVKEEKMSKIIIHNQTELPDTAILENYILPIMKEGEISELRTSQEQYCFATRFKHGMIVTCDKAGKETYTFRVKEEKK